MKTKLRTWSSSYSVCYNIGCKKDFDNFYISTVTRISGRQIYKFTWILIKNYYILPGANSLQYKCEIYRSSCESNFLSVALPSVFQVRLHLPVFSEVLQLNWIITNSDYLDSLFTFKEMIEFHSTLITHFRCHFHLLASTMAWHNSLK